MCINLSDIDILRSIGIDVHVITEDSFPSIKENVYHVKVWGNDGFFHETDVLGDNVATALAKMEELVDHLTIEQTIKAEVTFKCKTV